MNEEHQKELRTIMMHWAIEHGFDVTHLLAFLAITFVDTMVNLDYSEHFFEKRLEDLRKTFKNMNLIKEKKYGK